MAELKPFEVIMRIDYAASKGPEVVVHTERVQELVRCKECKYWCEVDTSDGLRYGQCDHPHSAIRGNCFIRESWFCADGERRVQE